MLVCVISYSQVEINGYVKSSITDLRPISDIYIEQLNHDYSFGTCISGFFGSFEPSIQQQYEDTLLRYFNSTVDEWSFKWPVVEPSQDNLQFAGADEKYYWSLENNLPMRGHTIFWANEIFSREHPDTVTGKV